MAFQRVITETHLGEISWEWVALLDIYLPGGINVKFWYYFCSVADISWQNMRFDSQVIYIMIQLWYEVDEMSTNVKTTYIS